MLLHGFTRVAPKFSKELSSKSLNIGDDFLSVSGKGGYSSALALSTRPFTTYYFEASIVHGNGEVRIGIASKDFEKLGPVGMDRNGYSFGSKNGYGFSMGKRIRFGERYGKNEIISVYLYKYKKKRVLEFFINGEKQLNKFIIQSPTTFWPAVSIYGECKVSFNFGPYFVYEDAVKYKVEEELKNGALEKKSDSEDSKTNSKSNPSYQ